MMVALCLGIALAIVALSLGFLYQEIQDRRADPPRQRDEDGPVERGDVLPMSPAPGPHPRHRHPRDAA